MRLILFYVLAAIFIIAECFIFRKLGINYTWAEQLSDLQYVLYLIGIIILMCINYFIIYLIGRKIL